MISDDGGETWAIEDDGGRERDREVGSSDGEREGDIDHVPSGSGADNSGHISCGNDPSTISWGFEHTKTTACAGGGAHTSGDGHQAEWLRALELGPVRAEELEAARARQAGINVGGASSSESDSAWA